MMRHTVLRASLAMAIIALICTLTACRSQVQQASPGKTETRVSDLPHPFGQIGPTPSLELSPAVAVATSSPSVTPTLTVVPNASYAVEFVVRSGIQPSAVAERLVGAPSYIQRAPGSGAFPNPEQADRSRRTWLVPIAPGAEQTALARAQRDPDVESASLVRWPPLVAHPE